MGDVLFTFKIAEKNHDLAEILRTLDAECGNCTSLSPLSCISRCTIWKLKNEFRQLREIMDNPNFMKDLFNVLKNETRLHILGAVVSRAYSLSQLQQELRKVGRSHSQDTISEEYLRPLMAVGLVAETQDKYYATMFGGKLAELLEVFPEFVNFLPAHSKCYEETLLSALLLGPLTFKDVETFVSPKVVSRVLKRLKTTGLIQTPEERDYIFFFKSKRNPRKEKFTSTERRVYNGIPEEGISAKKLAEETGLSLRRIYKYLRGLKGKKLVFTRKTPKKYCLTVEGSKLASVLQDLQRLVEKTWCSSEQIASNEKS